MQKKLNRVKFKAAFLIIVLVLSSCNKITPSGFWVNYRSDQITERKNDQGPWGGTFIINWVADKENKFDITDIQEIASQNDWKLIEQIEYQKVDLKKMTDNGKLTINLPLKNFSPEPKNSDLELKSFPRWIDTDFTLYRFKTGWLIFELGTDNSTQENGFILLSSDNKKMTVYHLWGE